ncbi:MAG TPA: hypothetical protein ENK81_02760, partial [Euryarchaeota archaeon]|nr:hypothetical protein [Euryarchaeota archaeon]
MAIKNWNKFRKAEMKLKNVLAKGREWNKKAREHIEELKILKSERREKFDELSSLREEKRKLLDVLNSLKRRRE